MFHETPVAWYDALSHWQQTTLAGLVTLVVGFIVVKFAKATVIRGLERSRHVDATLTSFAGGMVNVVGWLLLGAVTLGVMGVDIAALMGGLAIGGFIIGFAVKDTLGNLAAGVMLLFYRPFNMGETVTISGETGAIDAIGLALTRLKCADGRLVTIPNGAVLGDSIMNHTRAPIRRADVLVGIGYDDEIDVAVKAILDALAADARVLSDPPAGVRLTELGDNAIGLQVRPWVNTGDFWQAKADFHGIVKAALDDAGCSIPYPQRDVHLQGPAPPSP